MPIAEEDQPTSLEQAKAVFAELGERAMIKAIAGGGGRLVREAAELDGGVRALRLEAKAAEGGLVEEVVEAGATYRRSRCWPTWSA